MREYTFIVVDGDYKNKTAVIECCNKLICLAIETKLITADRAMKAGVLRCEVTIILPDDIKVETRNKKIFEIPDLKQIVENIKTQILNRPRYSEEPSRRP